DVVSGLILLGLCAVGAYSVSLLPAAGSTENVGPGGVPRAVLVILAVLSCILIVKGLRQMPDKRYWPEPRVFKKVLCFLGFIYLFLITLTGLGDLFAAMENPPFASGGAFCISTCLFLLIALPLLGRRKPVEVLLVAVLTTAVLLAAFGWFFQIMLP
ncbi:tripartite tricarboxylate transporter TctB family protein, partial [Muribaculaceae bacterium Isolate-002 (NCI)]